MDLPRQLASATDALRAVTVAGLSAVSDAGLLSLIEASAHNERLARAHSAALAGELVRRSTRELGHDGVAQKTGHRTAVKLIQATTGSTGREAAHAVRVGGLADTHPWLAAVAVAVATDRISTEAADAIRAGLGNPTDDVPSEVLATAADSLLTDAVTLNADQLYVRAREARDLLDQTGVVDRERAARDAREFRLHKLRDGSVRAVWRLDPVEGSVLIEIYDRATSPRRGGPRFVSEEQHIRQIVDDPRSIEQIASDTMFGLVTAGAEVNPAQLLGQGAPAVRVTITERELIARTGHGRLHGTQQVVSIETVERVACTQGTVPVVFDQHGQPLDVGREQRLFTPRQKLALAERDGGCRWGHCERPPSWCEAHHIDHWARDGGRTDVADGILLCKHHHLLLHDHHWEIQRRGPAHDDYWLIPPPNLADTHPQQMELKNRTLTDLLTG